MERHPRVSLGTPNASSMYHTCATYYRECRCYNSPLHCLCSSNRAVCKDLATVQWFWEYNQTGVSLWKPQYFRQKHHTDTTDLFCLHYWSKDFGHHHFIVSFLQLLNHWFNKICWPSIPWANNSSSDNWVFSFRWSFDISEVLTWWRLYASGLDTCLYRDKSKWHHQKLSAVWKRTLLTLLISCVCEG